MPCGDGACIRKRLNNVLRSFRRRIVTDGPVNFGPNMDLRRDLLTLAREGDYLWFTEPVVRHSAEDRWLTWFRYQSPAKRDGGDYFISPVD